MRQITLNMDKRTSEVKPNDSIKTIQYNLGKGITTLTVEELATLLNNGATMKASALNGNKNADWISQEVFALDFDNSEADMKKYGLVTIEAIIERCRVYNLTPAFYYTTFSHMKEEKGNVPKFRLVFITDNKITDIRVRNVVQMALMNIFPESDKACKDLSRVFFGSAQGVVEIDYTNTIDIADTVQSMVNYIQATDAAHAARIIKGYCQTVGLNMTNGLPDIKEVDEIGENACTLIIYIIRLHGISPKTTKLNFNIEIGAYKIQVNKTEGKVKGPKCNIEAVKSKADLVERFDFDSLEENCELYSNFINGTHWPIHTEAMHIAQNLCNLKGGQLRFGEAIDKYDYTSDEAWNKKNSFSYYSRMGYAPSKCNNENCPFKESCEKNGLNMLHQVNNKRSNIRKIEEETNTMELQTASEECEMAIRKGINENRQNIMNLIIAPTGIGKSTMLQRLAEEDPDSFKRTVVAFPNHKLLKEQVEKLKSYLPDLLYVHEAEYDNEAIKASVSNMQCLGNYSEARKTLERHVQELMILKEQVIGAEAKSHVYDQIESISSYLELSKIASTTTTPIFCTHKRLTMLNNKNIEKMIIDEDIVSTVVATMTLDIDSVRTARNRALELKLKSLEMALEGLYGYLEGLTKTENMVVDYPFQLAVVNAKEIKTLLKNYTPSFNIAEALEIKAAIKSSNGIITAYKTNKLPNVTATVLSATANETVYKALFPNREIEVTRVENVETVGKVITHHAGMSRNYLNQYFEKAVGKIKEEAPGVINIVSFKTFMSKFKKEGFNMICNYGSSTGIDAFGGQDLVVVGTPHVNIVVYMLMAHVCGIKESIKMEMDYVNVKRNGFEFTFSTFNSNDTSSTGNLIREIQFYLIESELIQAVGRARILRTNATVHLFSNLPIQGCKIYK